MKPKDLLARYKPAETTVEILLDGTLAETIEQVEAAIDVARRHDTRTGGLKSDVPRLEQELQSVLTEADAATVRITMKAVPGAVFDELKANHPPTEQQWQSYREQTRAMPLFTAAPEFDPETLAPELIAASVAAVDGEPVEWTPEEGHELWSTLHDGARADLLTAAFNVNGRRSARPLSATGTDTTSSTGPDSTTPPTTESPFLSLAEGS